MPLNPAKRLRLHTLYLLASDQARSRQDVARLLGVDRNTVARWLTAYRDGGLSALLTVYVPAGKRKPLMPDQVQLLQHALAQPQGFASFGVIQQWIADTCGVQLSYNATRKLVRYKLGAKLKVPRPSHQKNAEAVATFRASFGDQVQAVIPATQAQAVEVWAMDESRLGLHTIRRRRIRARGTQPVGSYQHAYSTFYLYGAIAPRTGDASFLGLPTLNAAHFQRFLDHFAQAHPHTLNVLLVDYSQAHTAAARQLPPNIRLLFQPPYAPDLTPAERVWRTLKDALAWSCFADLAALQGVDRRHAPVLDRLSVHYGGPQCTISIADSYETIVGSSGK